MISDALRIEVEADELPISISLIKPTAIHTPFPENAKERGAQDRFVLEHSLYQHAKLHPTLTATIAVAGGVALAAWLGSKVTSSTGLRAS